MSSRYRNHHQGLEHHHRVCIIVCKASSTSYHHVQVCMHCICIILLRVFIMEHRRACITSTVCMCIIKSSSTYHEYKSSYTIVSSLCTSLQCMSWSHTWVVHVSALSWRKHSCIHYIIITMIIIPQVVIHTRNGLCITELTMYAMCCGLCWEELQPNCDCAHTLKLRLLIRLRRLPT